MYNNLLVFGGGILQISIIEIAKKLGFRTIVIDPDHNAVGVEKADIFVRVDANDYLKTKKIADEYNVKGIVTSATDKPILMMCQIADELNLPFPSYISCETLLNKGKFKGFLKENHFPHAPGQVYDILMKIDAPEYKYPVIVKPLINSGSRGVFKCEYPEKLMDTIKETLLFCKDDKFIIEEYIEGDEVSVEAIVYNRKVIIVQITDKIVSASPYNVELGHSQPSIYSYKKEEISNLLQKVVDLSGIDNTVIHPELKINNDEITIIEIGPRLGGDYITSRLVPLSMEVNLEEIQIKIATNTPFKLNIVEKASLISFLDFPPDKIVKKIISEDRLKRIFPELIEFKHILNKGTQINRITNSMNRYGHYILKGDEIKRIQQISNKIRIFLMETFFQN
jgi:biotin carboxylase